MKKVIHWAFKGLGYLTATTFLAWGVIFWGFIFFGMYTGIYAFVG
jgi:hypothetical protein